MLIVGLAEPGFGWGSEGHRIVAEIAWRHLETGSREAVRRLLAPGETLAEASIWADRVRSDPRWEATAPFHYINVPEIAEIDAQRDCPPRGCILRAIASFSRDLGDLSRTVERRREALRFVAHLIGDVHQPLHVSHGSDRGGNDIPVLFFGRATDLHEVWDRWIVERARERSWWSWSPRRLSRSISAAQRDLWARGSPLDWAAESLALARTRAYGPRPGEALGRDYFERNVAVAREQLQKAGVRLAFTLDGLLGR